MRRLFGATTLVLLFTALSFSQPLSQEAQSNVDTTKTQVGYAVVTAAGSGGMVAFETFGFRNLGNLWQAGILPENLTTSAELFVDANRGMAEDLGVSIVNPNSAAANVTLTLNGEDGTSLGTTTIPVPAGQQLSKFVTELFANRPSIPQEIVGTLVINSTSPIGVVGLRFRGWNFSTIPVTSFSGALPVPSMGSGIGGANAVLLPQFVSGGGWESQIVISNPGTTAMTVRVDLFNSDSTPLSTTLNGQTGSSFTGLTIPAGGVLTLAPKDWDSNP